MVPKSLVALTLNLLPLAAPALVSGHPSHTNANVLRSATRSPFRQQLKNFGDAVYTAEVEVGGQKMESVLDTGSSDIFVFSKHCPRRYCIRRDILYDSHSSEHYRRGEAIATHVFGIRHLQSQEAFDSVMVGPLSSRAQPFWEVVDMDMPASELLFFSGIMGVGPKPRQLEAVDGEGGKSLCGGLGVSAFSMCIGRESGSPGYVVWNDGIPSASSTFPIIGVEHWAVPMVGARLENPHGVGAVVLGCQEGCAAVVDAAAPLLAVPSEVMRMIDKALLGLRKDCGNLADMPDLAFDIGRQRFNLPPDAYIGEVDGRSMSATGAYHKLWNRYARWRHHKCKPLVFGVDAVTEQGPLWVFGLPFLREYYATFAFGARKGAGGSQAQRTLSLALANDDCEPLGAEQDLSAARSKASTEEHGSSARAFIRHDNMKPHRVDLSQAYFPRWLEDATFTGFARL